MAVTILLGDKLMKIINEGIENTVTFYNDETTVISLSDKADIDKLEKFLKKNAKWAKVKISNGKNSFEVSTRALAMAGIEYLEKNKLI